MKKVLTILLALAVVFSMAGVVSAEITGDGGSQGMEVSHETEQRFTILIPTNVVFNNGLESVQSISASNVLIPAKSVLTVTVTSDNDFNLIYGSGLSISSIPYTVTKYDGNPVTGTDNIVLEVSEGVSSNSAAITFATTQDNIDSATMSGKHADTLTFTASIKGGEGEEDDGIIRIGNVEQLKAFAADVNSGNTYEGKTVKLTADIDLANEKWTPIGLNADGNNKFKGTFDGQGHTISNLNVETEAGYTAAGFFGALNGVAKNFIIDGATVNHISTGDATDNGIAVVAGSIYTKGSIDNVVVKNAVVEGNRYTGGIAGYAYGSVTNCKVIDSMITAVPNEKSSGVYDNGDKVGGIAGYWCSESIYSMTGNTVENVILKAYRDVGGITGTANDVTADNLKGNTVKDVTILVDQKTKSYGEKDKNAGEIVKRVTSGALVDGINTVENVVIYENAVSYTNGQTIQAFTEDIAVLLDEGTYSGLPAFSESNLKVTIIGAGKDKTTITLGTSTPNAKSADLIFEGVKFTRGTNDYCGIQHVSSIIYNDCAFEGQYFLYGKEIFNDCTFSIDNANAYNVWTYGASEVTFNSCQFNCAGKSVLIYNEGGNGQVANFNGCIFTASAPVEGKAAIEIDSSLLKDGKTYTVKIDSETTANGFAEGSVSGNSLWNVKKDTTPSSTTVNVNSETVYPSNP